MADSDRLITSHKPNDYDPIFWQQMQRLHQLTAIGRWMLVAVLWLTLAPISLWSLRSEIALWLDYFTWTAVRYGLAYHRFATFGLALCVGMTIATLVWQSSNLLFGLSEQRLKELEARVMKIRQQGESHPLWKWVIQDRT